MVGGSKRWAYSIVWEICGNTLVGEADFHHFRQLRWLRKWNSKTQSYYVFRVEANRGCKPKSVSFYLAREILGLQAGSAEEADHRNHDTLDNSPENLRVVSKGESKCNRKFWGLSRFKGVYPTKCGWVACIWVSQIRGTGAIVYFPTVRYEIEAGLMFDYAATIIQGEFRYRTVFQPDEMPTVERQEELLEMVVAKLKEKGHDVGEWKLVAA
jgi:hypothetical protein